MSGRKQQQRISAIKHPFLRRCRPWESRSPPGFTLSVDICEEYFRNGQELPDDVPELLRQGLAFIERSTGLQFGTGRRPLLVSARSGASVSMPGAMETILNIGLNRRTLRGLVAQTGNPKFAWDWYRRFLENFGTVVFSHDPEIYRKIEHLTMDREGVPDDAGLDFAALNPSRSSTNRCTRGRTGSGCLTMSSPSLNSRQRQFSSHGTANGRGCSGA